MINGVNCSNNAAGAAATTAAGGLNPADRDKMLSSTADLLKMSVSDLESKLASGSSLDDVARSQGVSHDDLVANIAASLKSQGASGASGTGRSDASLTAMATRIAGHHRHHGHHGAGQASAAGQSPAPASSTGAGNDAASTVTGGALLDVTA
jgi:hypothetical protein